jgi:coproporphyrinogen III oxidase-like Fe-S oxidoreductase
MKVLRDCFVFESGFEHAIELDPRYVTPLLAASLREIGINRASLGVQDVNPQVQAATADAGRRSCCSATARQWDRQSEFYAADRGLAPKDV